jgi:hypothetical protein
MDTQEKPKKSIFKKWWFWVIAVVVILIVIGEVNSPATPQTAGSSTASATPAPSAQPTTFKVGQPITLGSSVLTVNKVEVTNGGEFITPSSGDEFVNLNLTIQNTGNTEEDITTLGQMFIRDAGGNSYQVTVTDVTEQNMSDDLDGAVIANSKRTGWVGFEVPAGDKGLQFQYDASIFGGGTALVNLDQ